MSLSLKRARISSNRANKVSRRSSTCDCCDAQAASWLWRGRDACRRRPRRRPQNRPNHQRAPAVSRISNGSKAMRTGCPRAPHSYGFRCWRRTQSRRSLTSFSKIMRTAGRPSGVAVAKLIALGTSGSLAIASSYHWRNNAMGSAALGIGGGESMNTRVW